MIGESQDKNAKGTLSSHPKTRTVGVASELSHFSSSEQTREPQNSDVKSAFLFSFGVDPQQTLKNLVNLWMTQHLSIEFHIMLAADEQTISFRRFACVIGGI